jgi:hypothetical protein
MKLRLSPFVVGFFFGSAPQQQDASREGDVRFPNLIWAIRDHRLAHYEVAQHAGMEPSRFSRCLGGRLEFAPHERRLISEQLGIDEGWLFSRPAPKPLTSTVNGEVAASEPSASR